MHSIGITHRDLKPENVLLKDDEVRICDVGSSKILDQKPSRMNTPYVVSRYYRAPELLLASHHYGFEIDIWSVGCMIFEFITKKPMFPGDTEGLQLIEIQQILGAPSEYDLNEMQKNCHLEEDVNKMFTRILKIKTNQKIEIFDLLRCIKNYDEADLKQATDLIE